MCGCYPQLLAKTANNALSALNNAGTQVDPASAILYKSIAEIADCFIRSVSLNSPLPCAPWGWSYLPNSQGLFGDKQLALTCAGFTAAR